MSPVRLTLEHLAIPFRQAVSHTTATRACTESIIVKAVGLQGLVGVGEGCPRSYVTGESLETAKRFFESHRSSWERWEGLDHMQAWTAGNRQEIDTNPAAWCAVELAVLDLWAQKYRRSIEGFLGVSELEGAFQYSAVLATDDPAIFQKQATKFSSLGFADYKIKVSGHLEDDRRKLDILKTLGADMTRIRWDANNYWTDVQQAISYLEGLPCLPWGIEEPLQAGDYAGCRQIHRVLGVNIILDESFLREEQFSLIAEDPSVWIINLRLSKMGGILRSLVIADQARALGIPIIIGAQVGETSILTRAALTVANQYRHILLGQEGAFGTYLLEKDIARNSLMFGQGGRLNSQSVSGQPGLGLTVI